MKRFLLIALILCLLIAALLYYILGAKSDDKDTLTLFGNVDVRQVDLGFRVEGRVQTMPFQEGDLVFPGALMATLDKQPYADQVVEAIANISSIKTSLENAQKQVERRIKLLESNSISKEDYENTLTTRDTLTANLKQAEASLGVAETNLKDTEVYAPNEGSILTRIREPGTVVRPADPVYTLSLTSPVWIRAYISETDLGRIYPGMKANVYTDVKGGTVYQGHIGFISPVAEFTPKTVETTTLRTDLVYRLRIIADNPDHFLRQGMPVTVKLPLNQEKNDRTPP